MKKNILINCITTRGAALAGSAALLLFSGAAYAAPQLQSLQTRHTRVPVMDGQAAFVHTMDSSQSLHLEIALPLRSMGDLQNFIDDLYNPGSPNYRQYLSVDQFTKMFGPSQQDYDSVVRWARENGFVVTSTAPNRLVIGVNGRISDIERAFNVQMNVYHDPIANRDFYAPDREPAASAPVALWHVSGLDNYSVPKPMSIQREGAVPNLTGSGPSGYYLGSDMRAAYYGSGSLTGAGQSLGLLEYDSIGLADVTKYFSTYGPPLTTTVTPVSTDGTPATCTVCDGNEAEVALDVEHGVSMAPGMSKCLVYVGSTDTAIINRMVTDNIAKQISSSWSWRPADPSTLDPYFMEMATQGQTFFVASGDSGAWGPGTQFSWPADDQNVTAVGGTDLITSGPGGSWVSETAWVDSSGGISPNGIPIPSWQKNKKVVTKQNGASRTLRNVPDVAMEGNFDNWICYQNTCNGGWGGTSFAAPRWAGYLALVNQQAALNGDSPVGFINDDLYRIAKGRNYLANFHDITSGNNGGFNAVTGYDLVTGWGSPNGSRLINTLTN